MEGFPCHPFFQSGVPNYADNSVVNARVVLWNSRFQQMLASHRKSHRRRQACPTMTYTPTIVFAFVSLRETGDASQLTQSVKDRVTTCQQLVRVALMTCVQNDFVPWAIKNGMDGNENLNRTQSGSQMSTVFADGLDNCLANFLCQLFALINCQPLQILRKVKSLQQLPHNSRPRCFLTSPTRANSVREIRTCHNFGFCPAGQKKL